MAFEMSNLNRAIEKLSERLTNPYFINLDAINPFIQNQQNALPQNNSQIIPTPIPFTENHGNYNVAVEEGREIGGIKSVTYQCLKEKTQINGSYKRRDPNEWILQAERYSTFYSGSEKEKMEFQERSKEKRPEGGGACGCAWFRAWRFNRRRVTRRLLFGKPRWRWRKKTRLAFSRKRRGKEGNSKEDAKVVLGVNGRGDIRSENVTGLGWSLVGNTAGNEGDVRDVIISDMDWRRWVIFLRLVTEELLRRKVKQGSGSLVVDVITGNLCLFSGKESTILAGKTVSGGVGAEEVTGKVLCRWAGGE
jgi:hypothetical protein